MIFPYLWEKGKTKREKERERKEYKRKNIWMFKLNSTVIQLCKLHT